jgi:predicted small lipoprotein YifL
MKRFTYSSERLIRSALVIVLLAAVTATGCDSGGNVLTPPEGGATTDQAKPTPVKPKKGTSSRSDRERELEK